jgi:7-carboxy-7-deazaguanine synthase
LIRIAEIFESVQGEGMLTGTPSLFIRTSGCNLRCWFCDTRYASWEPEGPQQSIEQILQQVDRSRIAHVVLTGGEPMIFDEIGELSAAIRARGKHLTIETAGTMDAAKDGNGEAGTLNESAKNTETAMKANQQVNCDLWSISPKLSNSTPIGYADDAWVRRHDARRYTPHIVESLIARGEYQLKFVVGSILDAEEVLEYLKRLRGWAPDRVMLMPRGTTHEELQLQLSWLADWCRTHDLRLCDRQHIHWFGNRRGT